MSEPTISIVVPCHERAHLVGRAVRSLAEQTFASWEAIVVDDGSRDETARVVSELAQAEPRVRLVRHERNLGAQAARNTGIRNARGAWVTFLDADDWYLPRSIELRLEAARRTGAGVVHSEGLVLRDAGAEPLPYGAKPIEGDARKELLERSAMLFPTILVERSALLGIGGLAEDVRSFQEWDLALRLSKGHRFAFVPEPTFVYDCTQGDSISRSAGRTARGYEQVVRHHWRAIALECGPRTLAGHFGTAAGYYAEAGDAPNRLRCRALAALLWPPPTGAAVARRLLRTLQ
jgi:glycosyltransferase involved in cell wall biosynthesis